MTIEQELKALGEITTIFQGLPIEVQNRVIEYLNSLYDQRKREEKL